MRHVAAALPTTWQGRDPEVLATRLAVKDRAVAWYRRMRTPGVLSGIRALGARWTARLEKAASPTQTPSALERCFEDVLVLRHAGSTAAELRTITVELHQLITDLDDAPATAPALLRALHDANAAEARANLAESVLLTREDRAIPEAALDAVIAAFKAELAAKTQALELLSAYRRDLARARHGMTLSRGGRA